MTFMRLKALKVEIEHLQLLMDKAKVKLQKEFQVWWTEEANNLQVRCGDIRTFRWELSRARLWPPGDNVCGLGW